ncbi:MAG: DUF4189 domain-containing protein [Leptonema sp. (in: Bacteria)]|nr:DUF4189 domain-containing protein [Leptonema sp. (in: bacteria)]
MNLNKMLLALMISATVPMALMADSAIYFCEETGAYGASWGATMDKVSSHALSLCEENGGTKCEELISCEDTGFGAIAVSSNEVIGSACGYNSQIEANKAAIESCVQSDGENCKVKHTWNG